MFRKAIQTRRKDEIDNSWSFPGDVGSSACVRPPGVLASHTLCHPLLQPLLGVPPLGCTLCQVPPVICLELSYHLDVALTPMQPGGLKKEVTPHRHPWANAGMGVSG